MKKSTGGRGQGLFGYGSETKIQSFSTLRLLREREKTGEDELSMTIING